MQQMIESVKLDVLIEIFRTIKFLFKLMKSDNGPDLEER